MIINKNAFIFKIPEILYNCSVSLEDKFSRIQFRTVANKLKLISINQRNCPSSFICVYVCYASMLSQIERVNQVKLFGVLFISSLKATLHVDTVLSVINQHH